MISPPGIVVIAQALVLGRSDEQRGLVARASAATPSSARAWATAYAAGRFCRMASLLVGHDAETSLPPRALPCGKIGSVTAMPGGEIML